jgi:hypothetical protein
VPHTGESCELCSRPASNARRKKAGCCPLVSAFGDDARCALDSYWPGMSTGPASGNATSLGLEPG